MGGSLWNLVIGALPMVISESPMVWASTWTSWCPDRGKETWMLTAFEKKNSVPDNTTDTAKTNSGERNDTATPQNTVSNGKDTTVF